MKRELILCTLFGATLLAVTSCSRDSEPGTTPDSRVALRITGGIQTRAYNNTWEDGDAIGIYMLNGETSEAANREYTIAEGGTSGTFAPAADQTIYFPVDGSRRDFAAYYPHAAIGEDNLYPVNVATQAPRKAIDLMAATKVTGKSKTDPAVAFVFAHKLAKIEITLRGDGTSITDAELANTVVKITGQQTAGTYNVATGGDVAVTTGSPADILLLSAGLQAEGIVLPNSDTEGMELAFAVPAPINQTFTWAIKNAPRSQRFEAGKKYLYTITIAKMGVTVTSTIADWTQGNGTGGETGEAN